MANPNTPDCGDPNPVDGSGTSRNVYLTGSAFSDSDPGDTHQATDWVIGTEISGRSIVEGTQVWRSLADTTNLTSIFVNTINGAFEGDLEGLASLDRCTTYYLAIRYQDSTDNWSSWSNPQQFTTKCISVKDRGFSMRIKPRFSNGIFDGVR